MSHTQTHIHSHKHTREEDLLLHQCARTWDLEREQSDIICHRSYRADGAVICEHCVPVNVITHYPLSLPAQADWLHSSPPPSLPSSLSVFVISFTNARVLCFNFRRMCHGRKWHECFYKLLWLNGKAHKITSWIIYCINIQQIIHQDLHISNEI